MITRNSPVVFLRKVGFTLIELLIVISILAITSIAVYSVFASGMKIYQAASKQTPEEDLAIFYDKLTSDLRNSFKFKDVGFVGRRNAIEFATLVNSPRLKSRSAGKVVYFYDNQTDKLSRELLDFSHIYSGDHGRVQRLLGNVRNLKFKYYYYDAPTKKYIWKDEALEDEETLPLAVRIELELEADGRADSFVRNINIPAGG